MNFVVTTKDDGIATVVFSRGKVSPLNESVVDELDKSFQELADDPSVRAVIFTGKGKFFSFGFDIPEFMKCPKEDFVRYLTKFSKLSEKIFMFPKPVVAAINGHATAGGCAVLIPCDYRIMVMGKAKIGLNEVSFGGSFFAGCTEMLKHCVGPKNAETILLTGALYTAEEAQRLGMVDELSDEDTLMEKAKGVARGLARGDASAFRSIKHLLRKPVVDRVAPREKDSILELADIWYSESTMQRLKNIAIRS